MPVLSNPRWERFAQCIVQGLAESGGKYSQRQAYKAAGYSTTNNNRTDAAASRLLRRVKPILDRVAEIQSAVARRVNVTVASIVDELEEARSIATDEKQTATMVAATSAKAKILGLQVDRQEVGKPGDFTSAQSPDDIVQGLAQAHGQAIVSNDMKAMAIAEMERHSRALASIFAGEMSTDAAMPRMRIAAKPLITQHNQS